EERDAYAHLRQDARVLLLEADADAHGRFRAIGRRDDRDHARGDRPLGIRVQAHGDGLTRLHAIDEVLADVDLDLERVHVDDRAYARAREPARRRPRRDGLAFLRGLDRHDAGERRAHDRVLEIALRDGEIRLGHGERPLRDLDVHARPVVLGLRDVEVLGAHHPALELFPLALEDGSRVPDATPAASRYARAWSRGACACASAARWVVSSRRAMISPSSTRRPSSIESSTTRPVIFDETVACRRATT